MKKLIIIFLLLVGFSVSNAQIATSTFASEEAATTTLASVVSSYSDGQYITGNTPYQIDLVTPIPKWAANKNNTGYTMFVTFDMDSVWAVPPIVELILLKDTTGLGIELTNHGVLQSTNAFADNFAASTPYFSPISWGTWVAGARRSVITFQFFISYKLVKGKTNLYWLIVARSTWTPKQLGIIRLTVKAEAT